MFDDQSPAIPAATLVILRDRVDAPPELLMVERAKAMAFAAGALVFPGGRVDPGDVALAATMQGDDADDTAARIAAIRETIEEVGLPIGVSADVDVSEARAALHAGAPLMQALDSATLDLNALVPFARWRPSHATSRIFDTRFYLARLPADAPVAEEDHTENVRLLWTSAAAILAEADAGQAALIYPTRRNLERLALFGSYDDAVAQARAHPVRLISPFPAWRDGIEQLCIPDDLGYPVTAEPLDAAMRG
jgi:8-oxo-dGTP pyrophosphatase MutT (NUDIX family)